MAANEVIVKDNNNQMYIESVVNRWILDYYVFLAIESFKNEQYPDFCGIRNVIESVLPRPVESTEVMPTKIRVMQFLSRINDGESLDLSFESDQSVSPLESAMDVLKIISSEFSVPQQDFEKVLTSIKEMLVVICIKNKEFKKAKEVLYKLSPKEMVGKKAIFMDLINQKRKTHEVLEQINFHQFKKEMVQFCERICPHTVPFLLKAAKRLIVERVIEQEDDPAGPQTDEQEMPVLSPCVTDEAIQFAPCSSISNQTVIQRTRLEAAYKALAADSVERTIAQLEEEMEREDQNTTLQGTETESKLDRPPRRDSNSPMEASLADPVPVTDAVPQTEASCPLSKANFLLKRKRYTVAQLVVEPDSQGSSQCSPASQDLEAEVGTEEPAQPLATSNEGDLQSPVNDSKGTKSIRKRHRWASKALGKDSSALTQMSTDSEEDPLGSVATGKIPAPKLRKRVRKTRSKNSTESITLSEESEENLLDSLASCKIPVRKPRKQRANNPLGNSSRYINEVCVQDTALDNSPNMLPIHPSPQKSATPEKDSTPDIKWKRLYKSAKETKDTWSDEESLFNSNKKNGSFNGSSPGHRKLTWSDKESKMLIEAVDKFGEGNWAKILAYYSFKGRTNVNLKDRWRNMKKQNMV